jgi:hypothetical protein
VRTIRNPLIYFVNKTRNYLLLKPANKHYEAHCYVIFSSLLLPFFVQFLYSKSVETVLPLWLLCYAQFFLCCLKAETKFSTHTKQQIKIYFYIIYYLPCISIRLPSLQCSLYAVTELYGYEVCVIAKEYSDVLKSKAPYVIQLV